MRRSRPLLLVEDENVIDLLPFRISVPVVFIVNVFPSLLTCRVVVKVGFPSFFRTDLALNLSVRLTEIVSASGLPLTG